MTTMPATFDPIGAIGRAFTDLLGLNKGYGVMRFEVDASGDLVHVETIATLKMQPGETSEQFTRRIASYDRQPGDIIEITSEGGRYNVAKIKRAAR